MSFAFLLVVLVISIFLALVQADFGMFGLQLFSESSCVDPSTKTFVR